MATGTLELFDGSVTLDLLGSSYSAQRSSGFQMPRSPNTPTISAQQLSAIQFQPRTMSMELRVMGTSQVDLETKIRDLERMIARAQRRQLIGESSTKVVLKFQTGNNNANDISFTVISGGFSVGPDLLEDERLSKTFEAMGVLTLITESFGKLPSITLGRKTLDPEVDLAAGFNHMSRHPSDQLLAGPRKISVSV